MTPFPRRSESGPGDGLPDIVALADTDLLLDRLGDRAPYPDDLDDPLFASLAVLAADVDLDEVSPQRTRRIMAEHGLWPPQFDVDAAHVGRRVELTPVGSGLSQAVATPPRDWTAESRAQALAAEARSSQLRGMSALVDPGRTVGIRLVPALAAAGAAVVLSMGAAAALTNGVSVNPAKAIATVVQQITGEIDPGPASPADTGGERVDSSAARGIRGSNGLMTTPPVDLSPSPSVSLGASELMPSTIPDLVLTGDPLTGAVAPTLDPGATSEPTSAPLTATPAPSKTHPTHPTRDEHTTASTTHVAPTPTPTGPPDPPHTESSPPEASPTPSLSQTTPETPAEVAPPQDALIPPAT